MDRLTIKINDDDNIALCKGQVCAPNPCYQIQTDTMTGNCADCPTWGKIINRLAAYEDLNATPDECKAALELARNPEQFIIKIQSGLSEHEYKNAADYFDDCAKEFSFSDRSVGIFSAPDWEVDIYLQVRNILNTLADKSAAAKGREME